MLVHRSAHLLQGGEIAAMLQIAMMDYLPYTALPDGVFPHPTLGESLNTVFGDLEEPAWRQSARESELMAAASSNREASGAERVGGLAALYLSCGLIVALS